MKYSQEQAPQGFYNTEPQATIQHSYQVARQQFQVQSHHYQGFASDTNANASTYAQRELTPYCGGGHTQFYSLKTNISSVSPSFKPNAHSFYAHHKQSSCKPQVLAAEVAAYSDDPAIIFSTPMQAVSSAPISPVLKPDTTKFSLIEQQLNNTKSSSGENDQRSHPYQHADEEDRQTVSEILSMLSQEAQTPTKFGVPTGFFDLNATTPVTASTTTVAASKVKKEQKIYQRAKLLKAPKPSEVPIF